VAKVVAKPAPIAARPVAKVAAKPVAKVATPAKKIVSLARR
jgi:hypothetical protein